MTVDDLGTLKTHYKPEDKQQRVLASVEIDGYALAWRQLLVATDRTAKQGRLPPYKANDANSSILYPIHSPFPLVPFCSPSVPFPSPALSMFPFPFLPKSN